MKKAFKVGDAVRIKHPVAYEHYHDSPRILSLVLEKNGAYVSCHVNWQKAPWWFNPQNIELDLPEYE